MGVEPTNPVRSTPGWRVHDAPATPAGTREEAERAVRVHAQGCPAHQSVKDAIAITSDAEIEELPAAAT